MSKKSEKNKGITVLATFKIYITKVWLFYLWVPKIAMCQKYFLDKNFQNQPFLTSNSRNPVFHPYLKTSLTQAISLTEAMFMASSTVNFQLFYPYMKNTLGKEKSILGLVITALCKWRYIPQGLHNRRW